MTKREAIIKDLLRIFSEIKTASGYRTDLGLNVEEYSPGAMEKEKFPRCSVKDSDTDFTDTLPCADEQILTVQVFLLCAEKDNSLNYARKMIADIYTCIGKNLDFFYGKYGNIDFMPGGDQLDVQKEEKTIGGAMVTLQIKYTTTQWLVGDEEY